MLNIAIDGPSGAGKSTIAKEIAKRLNIIYLDTGAMYRAIGLKAVRLGIDTEDVQGVTGILDSTKIEIKYEDGVQIIYLDGEDVSTAIREHHISKAASNVSKIPAVRLKLVAMQREIAAKNNVVLDGRDITSYVLKDANNKFYLTATPEERAKRRYKELIEKGQNVDYETILADINDRDYNDTHRDFAPLTCTEDSVFIDSTELTVEQAIEKILSYIKM